LKNRTGRIATGAEHQSGQAEGCTDALQATEAGGGTRLVHQVLASGPPGVGARLLTATRQVRALRCQPIRRFRLLARTSGSQPEKTGSKRLHRPRRRAWPFRCAHNRRRLRTGEP